MPEGYLLEPGMHVMLEAVAGAQRGCQGVKAESSQDWRVDSLDLDERISVLKAWACPSAQQLIETVLQQGGYATKSEAEKSPTWLR